MSVVEKAYHQALDRMSGLERVQRTASLYASFWRMLALQVSRECPDLSERQVRKKVAARMYLSDEGAQKLLRSVKEA